LQAPLPPCFSALPRLNRVPAGLYGSLNESPPSQSLRGERHAALPYVAAIVVTVLWSSSFVLIKWGLSDIPPLFFATLRYALAFAVLLAVQTTFGRREQRTRPTGRRQAALLLVAGIAGYTVAQGFQFVGLYYLPAITTSFLLTFNPLFVLVLGVGLLGEGASLLQLGGLGLALVGAWAFFSARVAWGGQWLGVLVVVVSGLGWALYLVMVRFLQQSGYAGSLRLTTTTMGIGVGGMAVLTLLSGQYASLTASGVLTIVWLATANTALAFFMWNWALKTIPAYELTVLQNVMLVEIALFAFVFLQETITSVMVLGMALVLAGVFVVQAQAVRRGSRANRALRARP
jgi:drug/metabolite transporter (DMT)-like permease